MSHPAQEQLSSYLDGDLAPERQAEIDSHLAGCAGCRHRLDELRRLVRVLATLPDRSPRRDLWEGIALAIRPIDVPRRSRRRVLLPLAVAASVLLLASATVWLAIRMPLPASEAIAPGYEQALGETVTWLEDVEPRLDPVSVALLRQEVAVLDGALAEIGEALAQQPGNRWLEEQFARTSRTKWTYLREAPHLVPPRFVGD